MLSLSVPIDKSLSDSEFVRDDNEIQVSPAVDTKGRLAERRPRSTSPEHVVIRTVTGDTCEL